MDYSPVNLFLAYIYGLVVIVIEILVFKFIGKLLKAPNVLVSILIGLSLAKSLIMNISTYDVSIIVDVLLITTMIGLLILIDTKKIKWLTNHHDTTIYLWLKKPLNMLVLVGLIIGELISTFT